MYLSLFIPAPCADVAGVASMISHKFMADGLLKSIKGNVDGKSVDTAFVVISVNEEYGLIRALGLRPIKQALVENKGHSFDAITVIDPQNGQESVIYFNIDKPFK